MKTKRNNQVHTFHLVNPSPWLILAAIGTFVLTYGTALHMHGYNFISILIKTLFLIILFLVYTWCRDIIFLDRREEQDVAADNSLSSENSFFVTPYYYSPFIDHIVSMAILKVIDKFSEIRDGLTPPPHVVFILNEIVFFITFHLIFIATSFWCFLIFFWDWAPGNAINFDTQRYLFWLVCYPDHYIVVLSLLGFISCLAFVDSGNKCVARGGIVYTLASFAFLATNWMVNMYTYSDRHVALFYVGATLFIGLEMYRWAAIMKWTNVKSAVPWFFVFIAYGSARFGASEASGFNLFVYLIVGAFLGIIELSRWATIMPRVDAAINFNARELFTEGSISLFGFLGVLDILILSLDPDLGFYGNNHVVTAFFSAFGGGVAFAFYACFYYWLEKIAGLECSDSVSAFQFWFFFTGVNLILLTTHVKLLGITSFVLDNDGAWDFPVSLGLYLIFCSFLLHVIASTTLRPIELKKVAGYESSDLLSDIERIAGYEFSDSLIELSFWFVFIGVHISLFGAYF